MMIPRSAGRFAPRTRAGTLTLFVLLAFGSEAAAASRAEVMQMVSDEAVRNGRVPVALALAVARVESNFDDQAISSAGARGVMQIMPAVARAEPGPVAGQLMEAKVNVRLGVAQLERLYDQYGQDWELALSHYNGGRLRSSGGHFVAHRFTGRYVAEVMRWSRTYQSDGTVGALAEASGRTQWAWQSGDFLSPNVRWQVRPD